MVVKSSTNVSPSTEFQSPTNPDRNFAGAAAAQNVKQRKAKRERNFMPTRALNRSGMYECGVIPFFASLKFGTQPAHHILQPSFQAVQRGGEGPLLPRHLKSRMTQALMKFVIH
jgi:hypothetical protein